MTNPKTPTGTNRPTPLWTPSPERIERSEMTRYQRWLAEKRGLNFESYEALWQWSVQDLEGFWSSIWSFFEIKAHTPYDRVLGRRDMPHASWFEGATLNYAEHLLARAQRADAEQQPAIVFKSELDHDQTITWSQLNGRVGALMQTLRALNVEPGDRLVSYMPNIPHTGTAMMASAGIGAIWSSCSPDMGAVGVLDRFRQIEPTVLFAVDGYRYGGKDYDRREQVRQMVHELPSIRAVIFVPYLNEQNSLSLPGDCQAHVIGWEQATVNSVAPDFAAVHFDHPLWIVYSSGTTGMPKPIVHGHGGALIESLKGNALHLDIQDDDRFLWYTSTSWIMWNLWISTLATGATIVHYDGNPGDPDLNTLWRFAQDQRATFFGTSPAFIGLNIKAGIEPARDFDLSALRTVGATGSPLTDNGYRWIYEHVNNDVLLASISGGTDPGAAFLTSSPNLPVYSGEMQCRGLACAVAAYGDDGTSLMDEVGELVVTEPMPSMPLYFWGDTDGNRYHESYFDPWPDVWRHGDWLRLIERPESVTSVIYGRSDSTINRHGIRMGTSELYRVVEEFDWVMDSLAIDLEYLGKPSRLLLFIVLREPASTLSDKQRDHIRNAISQQLSARHVPNEIEAIDEVPRTMSGKKLEVPVKRILLGHDPQKILNRDAMANPETVDWFINYANRPLNPTS